MVLHHFSEDDTIELFEPHVPVTNPTQAPAVWTIDAERAPLYWFPRECPRIAVWPADRDDRRAFERAFATAAWRVHIIEFEWLEAMSETALFRYDFDGSGFQPWPEATGQWVARQPVRPIACRPVGNLLELHRRSRIELRLVDSLRSIAHMAASDRWDFSMVRLANATSTMDR